METGGSSFRAYLSNNEHTADFTFELHLFYSNNEECRGGQILKSMHSKRKCHFTVLSLLKALHCKYGMDFKGKDDAQPERI